MHRLSIRNRVATLVALGSLVGLIAVAPPAGAAPVKLGHGGGAYGSSIQLGSVLSSGRSALATVGCTNAGGIVRSNSAVSVNLLTAGGTGAVNDQVSTTHNSTTASSQVHSIALFSNLISASAVTATATTTRNDDATFATSGDVTAVALSINGSPMSVPAPNTVVPLNDLGNLTINEQIPVVKGGGASMEVNALHLHVTVTNAFNFPVGTDIIIGHARATLKQSPDRILHGHAFGTSVSGLGVASGKTALIHLPCDGTHGTVHSNTLASTSIPGVISTGTEKSTATGTVSPDFASGTTTASIQNVVLLNLVTVDSVKAQANVTLSAGETTFTDTGSSFGNISVLGVPTLPDPVPPNSQYDIPNLGTLYLHRITQTDRHIEVCMIELVLAVPVGPLAVGTDIKIGVATASAH